jgi:hypothetical protein
MKKKLLLLIFTVFLSGCISTSTFTGSSGSGVIIKSFSPSDTTAEPGTPVILQLIVSNTGTQRADGVSAQLLGLTDEWGISPGRYQSVGSLFGQDPARGNNQGEERPLIWTITGPSKDVQLSYEATVRVTYTYSTTMEAEMKAVTIDYYQQTKTKSGITQQKTSGGPLSITAKTTSVAISGGQMPVIFEIRNSGNGRVYSGGSPDVNSLDRLAISVSGASCPSNDVRLINGQSAVVYCTIPTGGISTFKITPISVKTSYNYYTDATTSISVLPRPPV